MVKVAVIGYTGVLGCCLKKILEEHPKAAIVYIANSRRSRGDLFKADCVFLALPHGKSRTFVAEHQNLLAGRKIIDLSADFRLEWVYGLPEINQQAIRNANRCANPGCYATSVLLGLGPLIGKLASTLICIDATSAISGARLKKRKKDNFFSYKIGQTHEHLPEMRMISGAADIIFNPLRCDNTDFGLISYIKVHGLKKEENIVEQYRRFYGREPWIRIVDRDIQQTADVIGTNYCDIKVQWECRDTLLIISALDNTLKGGASQSIQNFNLMFGFNESLGLEKYF